MQKNRKLTIFALGLLAVLIVAALLLYTAFGPDSAAQSGTKDISLTVVHSDGREVGFDIRTDCETLSDALEKEGIISGEEGPYGIYILTVDGETVDEAKQQWWCLTRDGQQHNQGADSTLIYDGDCYELTFNEGW